ncbi:MAG: hypothetical protein RDV48_23695, partial [Candidatus Eremiobacteraeota bacterium]|nr:hypothetical protein [Candidatus Eremiobacteraeota bacterium]
MSYNLRRIVALYLLFNFTFCLIAPPLMVFAEPQGGNVVSGNAIINQAGGVTSITQLSNQAIIEWQKFGININELVKFMQPSDIAVALNRVTGIDPSIILGSLQANGQIFLVNPNGIFFGPQARVDVAGLVATTLNISNEDFLKGNYKFVQDPSKPLSYIVNQGTIKAKDGGYIVLVAPLVNNEGVLIANLGKVALGASTEAYLNIDGQGLVNFVIPQSTDTPQGNVVIDSESVTDLMSQVLKPTTPPATSVSSNNGQVSLQNTPQAPSQPSAQSTPSAQVPQTAPSGDTASTTQAPPVESPTRPDNPSAPEVTTQAPVATTTAPETQAPVVTTTAPEAQAPVTQAPVAQVTEPTALTPPPLPDLPYPTAAPQQNSSQGTQVIVANGSGILMNSGTIQTNGAAGQNAGSVLLNSQQTTALLPGSSIQANGVGQNSSGGNVQVLSQGNTIFAQGASIQAMGGASGNGGFVEVSGQNAFIRGSVDTSAPQGEQGTFLIDPVYLTIIDGTGGGNMTPPILAADLPPDGGLVGTVDTATLEAYSGGTLTLEASDSITINDISDNTIQLNNNVNLEMSAGSGNIVFSDGSDAIATSGTGTISLEAGNNITLGKLQVDNAGSVTLQAGGNINQNAGATGNITADTASITTTGANSTIQTDFTAAPTNLTVSTNNTTAGITSGGGATSLVTLSDLDPTATTSLGLSTSNTAAQNMNLTVTNTGTAANLTMGNSTNSVTVSSLNATANGSILDDAVPGTTVTANSATLTATTGTIGAPGTPLATVLGTAGTPGTLTATTGAADQSINVTDTGTHLQNVNVSTNSGAVNVVNNAGTLSNDATDVVNSNMTDTNVSLNNTGGAMTINQVNVGGGDATLQASGAITGNTGVTNVTANAISLISSGAIGYDGFTVNPIAIDLQGVTNSISVSSGGQAYVADGPNDLSYDASQILNADFGTGTDVSFTTTANDVNLGEVSGNNVSITASGASHDIYHDASGGAYDINAQGAISLTSGGNIGASGSEIQTAGTGLTTTSTGPGNTFVNHDGTLDTFSVTTADGQAQITSTLSGNLYFGIDGHGGAGVLEATTINSNVYFHNTGNTGPPSTPGNIALNTVSVGNANVTLHAAGSITDNNAGANNINAVNLTMTADTGGIGTGAGGALETSVNSLTATTSTAAQAINVDNGSNALTSVNLTANNGTSSVTWDNNGGAAGTNSLAIGTVAGGITLNTPYDGGVSLGASGTDVTVNNTGGNIAVSQVYAGNTNDVSLTAQGNITHAAGSSNNVTADSLTMTATNGSIGASGTNFETAVNTLTATAGYGGIYVNEADGITYQNVTASANNATNNVSLTSAGTTTAANVSAGDNLTITVTGAGPDPFDGNDLTIGTVSAGTATSTSPTATITASGNVLMSSDAGATGLSAYWADIEAQGGSIGAETGGANPNALLTTVTNLTVSTPTAAQAININETNALSNLYITTNDGNANIIWHNSGNQSLTFAGTTSNALAASGGNTNVTFENTSDGITVNDVNVGTGTLNLTAAGSMVDGNDSIETTVNITAGTATLTVDSSNPAAAFNIGTIANPLEIANTVNNLTVSTNNGEVGLTNITTNGTLTFTGGATMDLNSPGALQVTPTLTFINSGNSTGGDISIQEVTGGTLTIQAQGDILDDDAGSGNDVTATALTLTAVTGSIGASGTAGAIETSTGSLTTNAQTAHEGIYISESNAITTLTVNTNNGPAGIYWDNNGGGTAGTNSLILTEVTVPYDGVSLNTPYDGVTDLGAVGTNVVVNNNPSGGGGGDIQVNQVITDGSSNYVTLEAHGNITDANAGSNNIVAQTFTATSETGSIGYDPTNGQNALETTVTNMTVETQGDNQEIFVTEADDLDNLHIITNNGQATVDLNPGVASTVNINTSDVLSTTGSGAPNTNVTVDNTGGNIAIGNSTSGNLTLNAYGAITSAGGTITTTGNPAGSQTDGTLTMNAGVGNSSGLNNGIGTAGAISTDTGVINASATNGGIAINEADAVTYNSITAGHTAGAASNVTLSSGGTATVNSVTAGTSAANDGDIAITATTGNIVLNSTGSANLQSVTDDITLTATAGNIVDQNNSSPTDIVSSGLSLNASGSVGTSGNAIDTSVSTLTGTTGGDMYINQIGAITYGVGGASPAPLQAGGDMVLTSQGPAIATNVISTAGDITINAENGSDIVAGEITASAAGHQITLNAGGSIENDGSSATDVSASNLLLIAGNNIGQHPSTTAGALDINTDTVAAQTTNGSVFLTESENSYTVGTVGIYNGITAGGDSANIRLEAEDTVTLLQPVIASDDQICIFANTGAIINSYGGDVLHSENLGLTAGTTIGASGSELDTDVTNLAATAGSDIWINETDTQTLDGLNISSITCGAVATNGITSTGGVVHLELTPPGSPPPGYDPTIDFEQPVTSTGMCVDANGGDILFTATSPINTTNLYLTGHNIGADADHPYITNTQNLAIDATGTVWLTEQDTAGNGLVIGGLPCGQSGVYANESIFITTTTGTGGTSGVLSIQAPVEAGFGGGANAGSVTLLTNNDAGPGNITSTAAGSITANSGSITLTTSPNAAGQSGYIDLSGAVNATGGAVSLTTGSNADDGHITVSNSVTGTGVTMTTSSTNNGGTVDVNGAVHATGAGGNVSITTDPNAGSGNISSNASGTITSDLGNVAISTSPNGAGQSGTISLAGTISAPNGPVTISSATNAGDGTISMAGATGTTVTVSTSNASTTSNVNINGAVTATGGSVNVTAQSASGSGNTADVTFGAGGSLTATGDNQGVIITAEEDIIDNNGAAVDIINTSTYGYAYLTAGGNIGASGNPVETNVNCLALQNTAAGSMYVEDVGILLGITIITANGDANVVWHNGGATPDNQLTFSGTSADLNTPVGGSYNGAVGTNVYLQNTNGNINVGAGHTLNAGTSTVFLVATGSITDNNGSGTALTAGNAALNAGTGISGDDGSFDTAVTNLATATTAGSLNINDADSITIDKINFNPCFGAAYSLTAVSAAGAGGTATISTSSGDINLNGASLGTTPAVTADMTATVSAAGSIVGDAETANPDVKVNNAGGSATLNAGTGNAGTQALPIETQVPSLSSTSGGTVFVNDSDGLTVSSVSAGGNVGITAGSNGTITVGTVSSPGNTVSLSTGGNIVDGNAGTVNITATNATLQGANVGYNGTTVDAIETDVTSIAAAASSGQVNLTELDTTTNNGITVSQIPSAITGTNVTGISATGAISLTSTPTGAGAIGAITIDSTVNSTNNGNVTINAGSSAGNDDVTFGASGSITVDNSAAGNTITVTSADSIVDNHAGTDITTTAGTATLTATGGNIGTSAAPIDTSIATLNATATNGTVFIYESDPLSITGITAGGNVGIQSGNMTLSGLIQAGGASTVSLYSTGTITDAYAAGTNDIVATNVTLQGTNIGASGNRIEIDATNLATSATSLYVTDTAGGITFDSINTAFNPSTLIEGVNTTGAATVYTNAGGNINLSGSNLGTHAAITSSGNAVTLNASGSIVGDDGNTNPDIVAGTTATLTATSGSVGTSGTHIETQVTNLQVTANNAANGTVYIDEYNSVNITGSGISAGNTVNLTTANSGNVNFNTVNAGISAGTNAVNINAAGSVTDSTASNDITAGTLTITAANAIGAVGSGAIDTTVSALDATATSGGVFINEANALTINNVSSGANVGITAGGTGDMTLSGAINAGGTSIVSLNAGGNIIDNYDGGNNITANNVSLQGGNVGYNGTTVNAIEIDATNLAGSATGGSGFYVDDAAGDITIQSITSAIDGTTAIQGINAAQNVTVNSPGTIYLAGTATNAAVTATSGTATLTAANSIAGVALNNNVDVAGSSANLTATGGSVGTSGNHLSTNLANLQVTATDAANGTVYVDETSGLNITGITAGNTVGVTTASGDINFNGAISAAGQTVNLNAAGSITDSNAGTDITAATANLTAGNAIGTAPPGMNQIETSVDNLNASTSTGGIYIYESNGLNIGGSGTGISAGGDVCIQAEEGDITISQPIDATLNFSNHTVSIGALNLDGLGGDGNIYDGNAAAGADITATNLTLSAYGNIGTDPHPDPPGGDAIDTEVTNIAAQSSNGVVNIHELDAGGDGITIDSLTPACGGSDVVGIQANQAIHLIVDNGNATFNEAAISTGSHILVETTNGSIIDNVTSGTGEAIIAPDLYLTGINIGSEAQPYQTDVTKISIEATGNVYLNEIDTAGNGITIDNVCYGEGIQAGGNITITTSATGVSGSIIVNSDITAGAASQGGTTGSVSLTSGASAGNDDITIGAAITANGSGQGVTITSAEDINDTHGGTDVSGGWASLTANNIGTGANPVETQVTCLSVQGTSSSGSLYVDEADGLSNLSVISPNGAATVNWDNNGAAAGTNQLTLNAGALVANGTNDSGTGTNLYVNNTGATSDITIATPITTNTGVGGNTVFLVAGDPLSPAAGNSISESVAGAAIVAGSAALQAGTISGNGTGGAFDTTIGTLAASTGTLGTTLAVTDTDDLIIGSVAFDTCVPGGDHTLTAVAAATDATVTAGGSLTVNEAVSGGNAAAGAGHVVLTAGTSMDINNSVTAGVNNGAGDVSMTANGGNIDLGGNVTANGDTVNITASNSIVDTDDATHQVTAATANLSATGGSIGASGADNAVDTSVTTLNATANSGNIYINEADSITYNSVTAGGNAVLNSGGAATATSVTAGGAGDVTITTTSGDISLGSVTAAGDTVTLTAAGAITSPGAGTNITAQDAVLSGTSIGASGGTNAVGTDVDTLTATASTGGVYISENNGITISAITANNGTNGAVNVTTSNDGDITTSGAISAGTSASLTAGGTGSIDVNASLTAGTSASLSGGGNITIDAPVSAGTTASVVAGGNVALNGNDTDPTVSAGTTATITATTGSIEGDSDDVKPDISAATANLTAGTTIGATDTLETSVTTLNASTTAGGIKINEANDVTLNSVIAGGNGDITIATTTLSDGTITVGTITADGNTVSITAGGTGSINDDSAATAITASDLHLTANGGHIGATGIGNELETSVANMTATAGNGGVYAANATNITLDNVSAAGGNIAITATGTMTATDVSTTGDNSDISLESSGNMTATHVYTTAGTGSDISLTSTGGALTATTVTTGNGNITLQSSGDADVTTLTAGGDGDISVTSSNGDINISATGLISALGDGVCLTASNGGLTNANGGAAVTASTMGVTTQDSIGASGSHLIVDVANIGAQSTAGGVFITDIDSLHDGFVVVNTPCGVNGVSAAGDVNLQLNGTSPSDFVFNAPVTAGAAGSLTLDNQNDGDITVNDDLSAGNNVTLTTSGGDISVTAGNTVTAGGTGDITVTSGADVTLGGGLTAAGDTVTVTAAGAIASTGTDTNITAATADLTAATGIGSGNALNTTVSSIEAQTATGGITIDQGATDVTLTDVHTTGADSDITITGGGKITATDVHTTNNNSDISLQSAGDMTATHVYTQGSTANIGITSTGGTMTATDVTTASGNITLQSAGQADITTVSAGTAAAGDGNVSITTTSGNVNLDTVSAGADSVTITAGGAGNINDTNAGAVNVTAGTAALNAGGSVGATGAGAIDTTITTLTGSAGTGFYVNESNTLAIGSPATAGNAITSGGAVEITADAGSITLNQAINAGTTNTVSITATAGSISDESGDTNTDIYGSTVTLTALNAIGAAGQSIETAATTLTAGATNGGVFLTDADTVSIGGAGITAGGNVCVQSTSGNITLDQVIDAGANTVSLGAANGTITDGNGDTNNITATSVTFNAQSVGASGNTIEITAANLAATATAGGIYVTDLTGDLTIDSIPAACGAGNVVGVNATGDVTIVTPGSLNLNGASLGTTEAIHSGGTATLTATTGAIVGDDDAPDNKPDIVATTATLTAGTTIGETNALETSVGTLNAATTDGSIWINEANNVTLNNVVAGGNGDITISTVAAGNGTITVGTVTASGNTVSLTAGGTGSIVDDGTAAAITANDVQLSAGGAIGASGNEIDTNVTSLTATAGTGGVYINENDGITINGITANDGTNGAIVLTTGNNGNITADGAISAGTSASLTAGGTGNIDINAALTAGTSASLNAGGNATIDNTVTAGTSVAIDVDGDATLNDAVTAGTTATIDAGGNIALNGPNGTPAVTAGTTATLNAGGSIEGDNDETDTDISAVTLNLTAGTTIGAVNPLETSVGTLNAATTNGGIWINEENDVTLNNVVAGGNGDITISTVAAGNGTITVGTVTASGNTVSLTAGGTGSIVDDGTAAAITANDVQLSAGGAIGASGNEIDTNVTSLTATAGTGGVYINENDGITINGITANDGTNGAIVLTTGNNGNITADGAISAGTSASLTAGGTGNIDINAALTAGTSASLNAGGNATIDNTVTAGTSVAIDVDGDATLNDAVTAGTTATIDAGGNIALNGPNGTPAVTAGTTATLNAGGSIEGDNDETDTDISAVTLNLTAGTTIGAVNPLETSVGTLNAATTNGGIWINEENDVTLNNVVAGGNGDITISTVAAGNGTITVGTVTASGNTVSLTAGGTGSIVDDGTAAAITANDVQLSAGGAIGASGNEIDTNVTSLTATAGTGGVYINENDGITINGITANDGTNGAIVLTTGNNGNITADGAISAGTSASLTAGGTGNIDINAALTAGTSASLNAGGNATIDNTVTAGTSVAIDVDGDATLNDAVTAGTTATLNAGGSIEG